MEYIKVKDEDHLLRDIYSGGIVSTDEDSYNNYIQNYKRTYNQNKRVQDLEDNVKEMKDDLNEIKNLLRSLANGSNQN